MDDRAKAGMMKARPILAGRAGRWYGPVALGLTMLVIGVLVPLAALRWQAFDARGLVGVDLGTYTEYARRFLETGSMYLPPQLAGPFEAQPYWLANDELPSMYPPHAVYLFAPFLVLPAAGWWGIPLAVIGYTLLRWRPAPWSWPILALLGLNVDATSGVIAGNTTMWLIAFVAGGLLWGWPAVLVTLKPSLLPFALFGIRRRSWWLGAGVMILACLPLLPQWLAYVTVVQNAETSLAYSLGSVPAMLVPVVAYFASAPPGQAGRAERPDPAPSRGDLAILDEERRVESQGSVASTWTAPVANTTTSCVLPAPLSRA